jgi:flagellar biosynthesis anti-sigma factor FlgM
MLQEPWVCPSQEKLGTDFDAEKVSRIAEAIRDGSFTVDAEAIADKLIAVFGERRGTPLH